MLITTIEPPGFVADTIRHFGPVRTAPRPDRARRQGVGCFMLEPKPRLSRGEYWILESVVEDRCPLCWLGSRNLEELFNKPGHGLGRDELADTLENLFQRGLIGVGDPDELGGGECLNRDKIEAALAESTPGEWTHYGLTTEGGRIWEAFAQPNWNAYIQLEMGGRRYRKMLPGMFTSANLWKVQKLIENSRHVGFSIDPNSIRRRLIRPWRATYWKALSEGHRVIFRYLDLDDPFCFNDTPSEVMELYANRGWYRWM